MWIGFEDANMYLSREPLEQWGWTLQEALLSPRLIFYGTRPFEPVAEPYYRISCTGCGGAFWSWGWTRIHDIRHAKSRFHFSERPYFYNMFSNTFLLHVRMILFTFTVELLVKVEQRYGKDADVRSCPAATPNFLPQFRSQQYSDEKMVSVGCAEIILQTWSKSPSPGEIMLPNDCKQAVRHGGG
jgi:hypothetical protein